MQQRTTLPIPTEAEEAQVLMDYMRLKQLLFTHVKNETGWSGSNKKVRNWSALLGAKDGVSPGFPDFLVVLPSQVIAIELKRRTGGRVSEEQLAWINALSLAGMPAKVCNGADESIKFIEEYS